MKNIVIIRSNPIKPDSRVEKEALALTKHGYLVTILCWDRDTTHDLEETYIPISNIRIRIIRLGFKATFGEGFKNINSYLKFQIAMRKWIKKNKNSIDLVHACDFDTAFFSYKLCKRLRKTFVFDIFDFLYGDPKSIFQILVKKAQIRIINHSDATIICTEERIKQIKGSKPKKLIVVHNSPSSEQLPTCIEKIKKDNSIIRVCYVGILQNGRLLKEIGEYFSKHNNIELHIGGFGYLDDYFKNLSLTHKNILFYGRLPYDKTLELEYNSDIILAIYDPTVENHKFAAPNKFYESLFLGKPVVMVKNTGMSEFVQNLSLGVLIDYSYEGFESGMSYLISHENDFNKMSKNAIKAYSMFEWKIMEKRLCNLYDELLLGSK